MLTSTLAWIRYSKSVLRDGRCLLSKYAAMEIFTGTVYRATQVKDYLIEKFHLEYLDKADVGELVDQDEVHQLAEENQTCQVR